MPDDTLDVPVDSIRTTVSRWIAAAIGWLLSAVLAWMVVLGLELVFQRGGDAPLQGRVAYLADQSLRLSLMASIPLCVLHLVRMALARAGRWQRPAMALALLAVVANPVWEQAQFLTSGGGIYDWRWVRELGVVLFAVLALGLHWLWRWHVSGLTAPTPERAERSGIAAFIAGYAWSLGGTIALVGLVYVLTFELKTYAYFARFLLLPTWVVAGTLVYRTCGGPMQRLWAAAVSALLLLGLGQVPRVTPPADVARARTEHLRRDKIAALNDVLTHRGAETLASFDLDEARRYDCARLLHPHAPEPLTVAPERRRNVLLISIDALRRDALGWVEAGRPVMPQLRNFAAHGVEFERAVTTYPATLLAMGGALTGMGARELAFATHVPDNVFTLASARFASRFAALPKSGWFDRKVVDSLLLQQAEREYFPDANAQTAWFIRRLKQTRREGGGALGWIHYYEPHARYETHESFDFGGTPRQRYMSEVAYVDHHLGRLLRFLSRNHWYEDTLVIVFSDHGQALGERDYVGQHVYLDRWLTDIPLLVRAPGLRPGKVEGLVNVTDVAATVLHFADLPPPACSSCKSLLASGGADPQRLALAEAFPTRPDALFHPGEKRVTNLKALQRRMDRMPTESRSYTPKVSVVSATRRLVVDRVTGHEELYDRVNDPEETRDLAPTAGPELTRLREALLRESALQAAAIQCRDDEAQRPRAKASRPQP